MNKVRPASHSSHFHSSSILSSSLDTEASFQSRAYPGYFVKHSNQLTLLLGGQEFGEREGGGGGRDKSEGGVGFGGGRGRGKGKESGPCYSAGCTMDGILAIPKPAGLLSIEVKVRLSPFGYFRFPSSFFFSLIFLFFCHVFFSDWDFLHIGSKPPTTSRLLATLTRPPLT